MSDQSPLVSVILPTHNRADTLTAAMRSVLDQSYRNLELIVVDDASTDATIEVVNAMDDPRIQLLRQETNSGAPAARNAGISEARGDYVAFQDSDDEWLPGKLAKQMEVFLASPTDVGAVYCAMLRFWGQRPTLIPGPDVGTRHGDISQELLFDNFVSTQTLIVRRSCFEQVGDFWECLPRFQDWELALRLASEWRFGFVEEVLVHVNETSGNISSDDSARAAALEMILERHGSKFRSVPTAYTRMNFALGQHFVLNADGRRARQYFFKGICATPFAVRPWAAFFITFLGRKAYAKITNTAKAFQQTRTS